LTAIPTGEISVLFVGYGFMVLTFLFLQLPDAEKVIFYTDKTVLSIFGLRIRVINATAPSLFNN
jgi:hypothetical protein